MSASNPVARRVTAIGILVTPVIVALGAFSIWAASYWTEATQRIHAAQSRIHAAEARSIQVSGYALVLDAWREHAKTEASGLVLGAEPALAQASVAARAKSAFAAAGGVVQRYIPADARIENGVRVHDIEAIGVLPTEGLPRLVSALETGAPRLFVEMLDVQPEADRNDRIRVALRARAYGVAAKEAKQ